MTLSVPTCTINSGEQARLIQSIKNVINPWYTKTILHSDLTECSEVVNTHPSSAILFQHHKH